MTAPESVEAAAQPPMNNILAQMHQERLRRHGADAHEPAPQTATPAPAPAAEESPPTIDEPSSSGLGTQTGLRSGAPAASPPSSPPAPPGDLKSRTEKAGGLSARKALAALTGERPPSGTRRADPVARRISLLSDDTPVPSAPASLPEVERPSPSASAKRGAREVPLPKQNLRRSAAQMEGGGAAEGARGSRLAEGERSERATSRSAGGLAAPVSKRAAAPPRRHPPSSSSSSASPSSARASRYATRTSNSAAQPQPRAGPPGVGPGPAGRGPPKETVRRSSARPGKEEGSSRRRGKDSEEGPSVSAQGEIYKEFQAQIKAQEEEDRKVAERMAQQDRKVFGVGDNGLARAMQEEADAREMMHLTDEQMAKELEEQYKTEARANRRGNNARPPAAGAGPGPGGRGRGAGARTRLPEVGRGGAARRAPARGGPARRQQDDARAEEPEIQPQLFGGGESDMDALLAQQLYQDQFDD